MLESEPQYFDAPHGPRLAYRRSTGANDRTGPGLVWLGGFRSDMEGGKATTLHDMADEDGRAFLRFDYSGHGASSGDFADGTIGAWRDDAVAALDHLTEGPQILIGSSMGGWTALLTALARPERVSGLVLIAPAPDFTETLMKPELPPEALKQIEANGVWMQPSDYGYEPSPVTRELLADGKTHCLLGQGGIPLTMPARILQGGQDPDVPWRHALRLVDELESPDVTFTLIKDGDHRLSRDADLARLKRTVRALAHAAPE